MGDKVHDPDGIAEVLLPGTVTLLSGDQESIVRNALRDRIIVQIPFAECGDLARGVGVVQLLRELPLPQDAAVVVQQHGPYIVLAEIIKAVTGQADSSICDLQRFRHDPDVGGGTAGGADDLEAADDIEKYIQK